MISAVRGITPSRTPAVLRRFASIDSFPSPCPFPQPPIPISLRSLSRPAILKPTVPQAGIEAPHTWPHLTPYASFHFLHRTIGHRSVSFGGIAFGIKSRKRSETGIVFSKPLNSRTASKVDNVA